MLQALRGSLLKKYAKIRTEIDRQHNSRMSPYEKTESLEAIRSHIMAAWRTDEIRRTKPSPQVGHLRVHVNVCACGAAISAEILSGWKSIYIV